MNIFITRTLHFSSLIKNARSSTQLVRIPDHKAAKSLPVSEDRNNAVKLSLLQSAIIKALGASLAQQNYDGHWRYNIEGYAWSPAEYILCMKYIDQAGSATNVALFPKLANYIRKRQLPSGGWGLEPESHKVHISSSVMAYFALKVIGDPELEPHMVKARNAILGNGGLSACNQLVRFHLALHGIIPWTGVLEMPVEIMLLPKWFPFTIYKISMARVIIIPMLVLRAIGKSTETSVDLQELMPGQRSMIRSLGKYEYQTWPWYLTIKNVNFLLKYVKRVLPKQIHKLAVAKAIEYVAERLNGRNGFGSTTVPIQFALMMFHALGYSPDHPHFVMQRQALERLIVYDRDNSAYIAPFFSPVWDTSLTIHALLETEDKFALAAAKKGIDWLVSRQILHQKGDWAVTRRDLSPGGWAYFYRNPYFPDTDDTSVVLMAIHRYSTTANTKNYNESIRRGMGWLVGMQCENGGWGAFDADNTSMYLDNIPFVEDRTILDPPTADITARGLSTLTQIQGSETLSETARDAKKFLLRTQEPDGSWYGRWGVNYIYGTWSALIALNSAGVSHEHESIRKAVAWLLKIQNEDGGWGEDCESYRHDYSGHVKRESSPTQTAWALLGLMGSGIIKHPAVEGGIRHLLESQNSNGQWNDNRYTGVAVSNFVYYLNHGYCKYFPLLVIARYYRLTANRLTKIKFGF